MSSIAQLFMILVLFNFVGVRPASAAVTSVRMIQAKAFFTPIEGGLYEPLDLKEKSIVFKSDDVTQCSQNLIRQSRSLKYSCTIKVPSSAKLSKLRRQLTPAQYDIPFGSGKKAVQVKVNAEATQVTFETEFDMTGIDFSITGRFNDDFGHVFAKTAQLLIAEAMEKPLKLQVLESL